VKKQPLFLAGILLVTSLCVGLLVNVPATTATPDSDYVFLLQWGDQAPAGQFNRPMGIAVDAEGYVYVADMENARIQKFTSEGAFVTAWGSLGNGEGEFGDPVDVAVDDSGAVYVLDAFHSRVQKFTADGTFLGMWGSRCVLVTGEGCVDPDGSGPLEVGDGQFASPRGIAVDSAGHVYIADSQNHRVQKFTSDGAFVTKWGREGYGSGQFHVLNAIAVDEQGNVYVADISRSAGGRTQKFTSEGDFLEQWFSLPIEVGYRDPLPTAIWGITVDGQSDVYVTAGSFVQKFTADGMFLEMWPGLDTGENLAQIDLQGIAVDTDGHLYVTDGYHRLRKFTADGTLVTQWGRFGASDRQLYRPSDLGIDNQGNVYIGSPGNNPFYPFSRVQKFDSNGNFLSIFGSYCNLRSGEGCVGAGEAQFSGVPGIAVDRSDNVYVLDFNGRVQKFAPDGTFLLAWGSWGSEDDQFQRPMGITVDGEDNVYVTDWIHQQVKKFRSDGTFLLAWGSAGREPGQFNAPTGIAVDNAGHVYVVDRFNDRIQEFTANGTFPEMWGNRGSNEGQLFHPYDIAVDAQGYVYVTDEANQRVQKFTSDGEFVTAWGSRGADEGQFDYPLGIAVDSDGHVFVVDYQHQRIQKFGDGTTAHRHTHGYSERCRNVDTNPHNYANSDCDCHPDTDRYANYHSHRDAHHYRDTHYDTHGYAHPG